MKRILWIFCSILIGTSSLMMAQEPSDSTLVVEEVVPQPTIYSDTISIDRITTDEIINEGFAKFGNPVSATIFYAPSFGEDVITREVGVDRSEKAFYENPPFNLTYTADEGAAYGKLFVVKGTEDGGMAITFPTEMKVPLGQEIELEGGTLKITQDSYISEGDQLALNVSYTGDTDIILNINSESLEEGADASQLREVVLAYTQTVPVGADGTVSAEGFNFNITPNTSSTYSVSPEKTYSFQVNQVSFFP